jgi:hypothetical protein
MNRLMYRSWCARQQARFGGDQHDRRGEAVEAIAGWVIGMAALALILYCLGASHALALPCLGKLERGADHYRIVHGTRCWYVGEEVPDKSEFARPKRKETLRETVPHRRQSAASPGAASLRPRLAAQDSADVPNVVASDGALPFPQAQADEWLAADRTDAMAALCGGPCPDLSGAEEPPPAIARIQEAFEALTVQPARISWLWVRD